MVSGSGSLDYGFNIFFANFFPHNLIPVNKMNGLDLGSLAVSKKGNNCFFEFTDLESCRRKMKIAAI